nr:YybS family protein [Bacillus sp. FJAT-49736]
MLTIYIVLLLAFLYIPVIYVIAAMFLVLPFLLYSAKHPLKYSFVFFVTSILISALLGTVLSIPATFIFGTTGMVMGYCVQMKKSKATIFVASSLTFLIDLVLGYVIAARFFHFNILQQMVKYLRTSFEQTAEILKAIGQEQNNQALERLNEIITIIQTLFPALLVIMSFMFVWLFIVINFPIAKRLRVQVPKWQPFHKLQLPKSLLWYYLITMLLTFFIHPKTGSFLAAALLNLSSLLQILMLLQGFSLIAYFGNIKKWPKSLFILIICVAFLFPPSMFIILMLGIMDVGMDIRKKLMGK